MFENALHRIMKIMTWVVYMDSTEVRCILSTQGSSVGVSVWVASPGSWGGWPCYHLKCLMDRVVGFHVAFFTADTFNCKGQDPHLVWFIASMTYLWLFLKAAPTFREYIYLFIYLFYCFSGKNAVRVISLFLDSASLKVCNFTVLTPCVPMHLSWPVCPVVHTAGLEEHPDITTGSGVSHVSVEELFPINCWENKKISVFQKFCLACQALILF